jgi:WD40 repeat protein
MFRINRWLAALLVLVMGGTVRAADDGDFQPVAPSSRFRIADFRDYYGGRDEGGWAIAPDGKTIVMSMRGPVMLYDLVKRKKPRQPRNLLMDNQIYGLQVAFAPDGKTVVGINGQMYGNQEATVYFWDAATGKEVRQLDNDQPFMRLAFSPDGKHLALAGQQRIELWDAATGDEVRVFPGTGNFMNRALEFAPDGKTLASAGLGGVVQLWEIANGKERHKFRLGSEQPEQPMFRRFGRIENGPIETLAFSADGKLLAAGGNDNAIHVWDLLSGQELPPLTGHQSQVRALLFTADGKELISVDASGLKLAWNVSRIVKSVPAKLAALSDGEFDELWDDLAEADAFRTYRAQKHLTADPKRSLALLGRQVKPVPVGDSARIAQLVADLQSPNAGTRRKAMTELRKHGEAALGALSDLPQEKRQFGGGAVPIMYNKLEGLYATADQQRSVKAVDVLEQIGTPEARQLLEKLSKGAAGTKLTKAAKTALERLKNTGAKDGAKPANAEALWNDLASDDAVAAYRAIRGLAAMPKEAMPLLREHLKPVQGVDAKRIEQLIADLDSNEFSVREKATADLEELGEQARPALKKALEGEPALDTKKRIEKLIEKLTAGQAPSGKLLRTLRAVEALERLDTDEARQLLQALAKGAAEARLTRDAKDALARLGKKPAMR